MFADDGEDGEEVGEGEEFFDSFAEVDEVELAARGFGRGVEADEGAQAHAVHIGEVAEIEDDTFGAGDEWADAGGEDVGDAVDQCPVAADDDEVRGGGAVDV